MERQELHRASRRAHFNGAAGVNPRMAAGLGECYFNACVLQWGRGCEPADGPNASPYTARIPQNFNGAAGVNPRMVVALVLPLHLLMVLQWGRGCEPADGAHADDLARKQKELQWGRGCEPADGGYRLSGQKTPGDFNGAAGVNPRMACLRRWAAS